MTRNIFLATLFSLSTIISFAQWNPIPDGHCFTPGGGSYFPLPPEHRVSDNDVIFRYEFYQISASQGYAYDICKSVNDQAGSSLYANASSTVGSSCCSVNRVRVINDSSITYAIHYNPGATIGRYVAGLGQTETLILFNTLYNYTSTKRCIYGLDNPSPSSIRLSKIVKGVTSLTPLNYQNITGLPNIFFMNDSLGFIVGKDTSNTDVLIRTENYGVTWYRVLNPVAVINDIVFKGDTGFAVGNGGIVYRSFNKGLSWVLQPSFTGNKLNSVSINSMSVCYVAGDNATLFKTSDFGNNWIQEILTITTNIDWVKSTNTGGAYFQSQNLVYKQNYFASVNELKSSNGNLKVYPNPALNILNVEMDEKMPARFSIYVINGLGEIVLETDKSTIDLSEISCGLYSLELRASEGNVLRSKVIKVNN